MSLECVDGRRDVAGNNETADFAARLRELKDRSGLSYGALAKRLHMSTSTLHRYCNGDAVPTDYAPVERFARLCKAAPEELVELHRSWVLAGAARTRERAANEAVSAADADQGRPTEAPGDADRDGDGPAMGSGVGPGAVPVPAPVPAPSPISPDGTIGARPDPEPAEPSAYELGPAPRTAAVTRRLSERRRRAVVASAAVVVLATGALLASHLASGSGPSTNLSAGESSGHQTASSGLPSPGSPSPSATRSPATRSPSASQSPSPSSGATGGGAAAQETAPPLTVVTRPYAWEDPCSQSYLVNRPPAQVPPPPVEQDAPAWVKALGGVSAGGQYLELTVQGTGKATVVLEALHVRVVESGTPLPWNVYAMGDGCGGGVGTKSFDVNLDAGDPQALAKSGQRALPLKVSESDPEVLRVTAHTSAHDVSWYLELEWSSGDRHGILRIDDQGKPFRTSGTKGRSGYVYPLGGNGWIATDCLSYCADGTSSP